MKLHLLITTIAIILVPRLVSSQVTPTVNIDTLNAQVGSLKKDINLLKRFKVSGYLQPQYQVADSLGQTSIAGGNFQPGVNNRFMLRRGRIKFQYTGAANSKGISSSQYVLQFDVTERGLTIKDAYAKITDPWSGWVSLTAGVFNNPFGYEVYYSSSLRESPERARMSQLHFPNEREVGAMITLQGPKNSKWNWLKLDAGFFNGNGAPGFGGDVSDFDSNKDFSGRISMEKSIKEDKIKYGFGVSYYDGGYRIDSVTVYKSGVDANGTTGFVIDTKAIDNATVGLVNRKFTTRKYVGVDGQFSIKWKPGVTILKAEFLMGDQPGASADSKSPNDKNAITRDTYQRKFNGAYFYFVQSILKTPFQLLVKYDWYDPNTDVKGDELGKSMIGSAKATSGGDVRYDTYGFGLLYHFDANIRVTAYYDLVKNEISKNLSGFTQDRSDNVFTCGCK
ncbi:MAG: hypothetical protein IPP71_15615 [Bacteroidetes bacterium]|nr:hypothetical protein [Bacteroidota bacterium]